MALLVELQVLVLVHNVAHCTPAHSWNMPGGQELVELVDIPGECRLAERAAPDSFA